MAVRLKTANLGGNRKTQSRAQWYSYRRRTELGLLILVSIITVGAYVIASLGQTAKIPSDIGPFLGVILLLSLVAHIANRRLVPQASPVILPLAALLNGIGYVVIALLDYREASLQAAWTAVGVAAYVITLLVVRKTIDLDRFRYLMAFAGIFLLFLPLVPHLGENINGARLWIRLGPATFQPVEIAKLALCVFFASYLVEKRELLSMSTLRVGDRLVPDPRPLGPVLLAWGISMLAIAAERDIGFAVLIFILFVSMIWVATGRFAYILLAAVLFALGAVIAGHLFAQVHVRIGDWLDPWGHPVTGYQLRQAQYAMGWGGLTGDGLGLGHPNLIPVVTSDFIFAAIGEELGLLGTTAIVFAFVLLVGAGLRTAVTARTDFSKLVATGFTTVIGLQAFLIMAGVTRVLPVTGITLPFVAYGGSSLLANYILIALLMRISNEADDPRLKPPSEDEPAVQSPYGAPR